MYVCMYIYMKMFQNGMPGMQCEVHAIPGRLDRLHERFGAHKKSSSVSSVSLSFHHFLHEKAAISRYHRIIDLWAKVTYILVFPPWTGQIPARGQRQWLDLCPGCSAAHGMIGSGGFPQKRDPKSSKHSPF